MTPNKSFNLAPFPNMGSLIDTASQRENQQQRARLTPKRGDSVQEEEALATAAHCTLYLTDEGTRAQAGYIGPIWANWFDQTVSGRARI